MPLMTRPKDLAPMPTPMVRLVSQDRAPLRKSGNHSAWSQSKRELSVLIFEIMRAIARIAVAGRVLGINRDTMASLVGMDELLAVLGNVASIRMGEFCNRGSHS